MYNQCFTHVHPLWCVIAFIQFGADGRDESDPTPTECALRIVHAHQCLSTYTHIYATCIHCRGRFIVPAYHGMYGVDNRVQPMFILVRPLWCMIAFIQFGMDGRDESDPTPTECALRIVHAHQCLFHEHVIFTHVHQRLPTCTHCREPIYRARILRNVRCGYFFVSLILFFICAIVSVHSWYLILEVWHRLTSPPHWIKID